MPVKSPVPNWLEPHLPVCEAIVALFAPLAEVAVHDIRRDRIVGIWNPISERKVGDRSLIDELPPYPEDARVIGPYPKVLADGRAITSVSVVLHNAKGVPRGLLCINFDRSPLDGIDRPARALRGAGRGPAAGALRPGLARADPPRRRRGVPRRAPCAATVSRASSASTLVRVLDERGLFATRNAAAHAGEGPGRVPHHHLRLAQGGTLMKPLRTFRLEEYLGEWEFKVRYHLTASDAESITVEELLALGTDADREGLMKLPLSYIETWGTPELREAIAGTYERVDADHVLAFAGAEEALFWAMQELVGPGDHAVVTVPVLPVDGDGDAGDGRRRERAGACIRENGWALDLDELRALLRPNTRLVAVNFPNNPTGYVPGRGDLPRAGGAVRRARHPPLLRRGLPRHRGGPRRGRITQAADLSETAVSLNVASKSYGLPGLRVGWLACRDRALLERLEKRKHYTSICNAGPAEYLAAVALRNRERIWDAQPRHRRRQPCRCSTTSSRAGRTSSTGSRRWAAASASRATRAATSRTSARRLLDEEGVLVLPASMYYSEIAETPADHFRVGIGRLGLEKGLAGLRPLPARTELNSLQEAISDRACPLLAAPASGPDTWRKWFLDLLA